MFDNFSLPTILVSYVALLFSLCVHEAAHAWSARALGDDTAERLGRLTLNPVAHMDPIGTFLFPLLGMATGLPFIGWAKPVPVSPNRFDRKWTLRGGMALVASAGPLSNVALALVFFVALTLGLRAFTPLPFLRWELFWASINGLKGLAEYDLSGTSTVLFALAGRLVLVNIFLAIFNLIPAGPLDGASVVKGFLSYRSAQAFERMQPYLYVALLVLVFIPALGRYVFGPIVGAVGFGLKLGARLLLGV